MSFAFYLAAGTAIVSTALAITRIHPVTALLWLIVSLLGTAVMMFTLGAPLMAALEVIIYAGAIVVLFIFSVMLVHPDPRRPPAIAPPRPLAWLLPGILAAGLVLELSFLAGAGEADGPARVVGPVEVAAQLYGPYVIAVELAGLLLTAALIAAWHLGRQTGEGEMVGSGRAEEGDTQ